MRDCTDKNEKNAKMKGLANAYIALDDNLYEFIRVFSQLFISSVLFILSVVILMLSVGK